MGKVLRDPPNRKRVFVPTGASSSPDRSHWICPALPLTGQWHTKVNESFHARGGWWVIGQSLLMTAILILGVVSPGATAPVGGRIAGSLLIVLGAWLGLAGVRALGPARTAFPRPLPSSCLVRSGPYRLVRHPLYLSVLLVSAGWAVCWRSLPAMGLAVVLGALLHYKARMEERWLREEFPEYRAYAREVGRLFPKLF